ncbi:MAG: rhomboid family intramembrane serine protease [Bacteroidota bacterium]
MLNNLPQVTKNILILNVLFFIATLVFQERGVDLIQLLGAHYVNSPLFNPYQIVTYFFMHGNFFHILMNMYLFVILGSYLERLWGAKRFFIFYIICAVAAFGLYNIIGAYELYHLKQILISQDFPIDNINSLLKEHKVITELYASSAEYGLYAEKASLPMVGASGAIFGIMTAFAILFPNTEFLLYFAIPVKAKFLVGFYLLFEVIMAFQNNYNDPVAHLAHIGGAIAGAIIVLIWRKKDRANFW